MKNMIMIALLTIFLAACKKDKTETTVTAVDQATIPVTPVIPEPQKTANASVTGKIVPLEMAKLVRLKLISQTDGQIYYAYADANGALNISLPPGPYGVELHRTDVPAVYRLQPLVINNGQVKDLYTLNFGTDGKSFTINGTATITGTVTPANAGNLAYAVNRQTLYLYKVSVDATGKFEIKDLPDGTYTVSVSANANFTPTATPTEPVVVGVGQTAAAGTYRFNDNTLPSSVNYLTYELDGIKKYRDNYNKVFYLESKFGLYSYTMAVVDIVSIDTRRSIIADRLDLALDQVKGIGTYSLNGSGSFIRITHQEIKNTGTSPYSMSNKRIPGVLSIWSTTASGGSGTITITEIDHVNKTISGTFSCTAVPENAAASGKRSITKGEFKNYSYQEIGF